MRRTAEALQFHSPERLRDGQLSPVDDAWGLAATLYRALTNANPFGQTRAEVMERQQHVLVPITHYGVNDPQLLAILAAALIADPRRRTANVATFRMQLEHWSQQPHFRALPPLEDEESPEDDAAATAMLPMEGMIFDDHPPKFDTSRGSAPDSRPQSFSSSPLGEQDATVMRELPAHIIALAARAASGSSPPPPPGPPSPEELATPAHAEEDFGQATRIAPAPQLGAMLGLQPVPPPAPPHRPPPGPPPSAPRQPPPSQPKPDTSTLASAQNPPPPVSRPRVPRAFKSTQLGMGTDEASRMANGPRDGFAPPPSSVSTHPPPRDPDDVRTVMHQAPVAELLARAQNPGPPSPPVPAAGRMEPTPMLSTAQPRVLIGDDRQALDEDDDDGGRTVMRDAPAPAGPAFSPPAPPPPREAQWAPAAPPLQVGTQAGPFQPTAQTDRPPQPGMQVQPHMSLGSPPTGPGFGGDGAGVSALISETLAAMGPAPLNGAGLGTPPGGLPTAMPGTPPGFPQQEFQPSALGVSQQPFGMQQHGTSAVFPSPAGVPMGMPGGTVMNPMADGMMQQAPPAFPQQPLVAPGPPSAAAARGSRLMLVIVCMLVLILAAAVTFLTLKFRAQIGF